LSYVELAEAFPDVWREKIKSNAKRKG